ncbi:MAG: hypothetical protein EAZ21_02685 [Betaproteobacteria bacterium]|nr:MAG: hypothetical protein EAZ21_02685 [Betaproteobacteria bacterium]
MADPFVGASVMMRRLIVLGFVGAGLTARLNRRTKARSDVKLSPTGTERGQARAYKTRSPDARHPGYASLIARRSG